MTDSLRTKRYWKLVNTVGEHHPVLAHAMYRVGGPHFNNPFVASAWVARLKTGQVRLEINRDFWDVLTDVEAMFVSVHESAHVFMNHFSRRGDRCRVTWNVATDCCVNQFLLGMPAFRIHRTKRDFKRFLAQAVTFQSLEGLGLHIPLRKRASMPAERVCDLLKGRTIEVIDHILATGARLSDGDLRDLNTVLDPFVGVRLRHVAGGKRNAEPAPDFAGETKRLSWDAVFKRRLARGCDNKAISWLPRRTLAWAYPDVLLPQERSLPTLFGNQRKILLAIDSSASMAPELLPAIRNAFELVPMNNREVEWVQFDSKVHPISPEQPLRSGGGTSFQSLVDWIEAKPANEAPSLVVVATDGMASTHDEVVAIIQYCRETPSARWMANLLLTLATTGMRIGEVADMRWSMDLL